jgi:hypothetical protein
VPIFRLCPSLFGEPPAQNDLQNAQMDTRCKLLEEQGYVSSRVPMFARAGVRQSLAAVFVHTTEHAPASTRELLCSTVAVTLLAAVLATQHH